jgi:hypothetical protein
LGTEGSGRSAGREVAIDPVGGGEDRTEVVRRVAPFGGEPGVVEVEPPDDRPDVERALHGIEFVTRARHAGAVLDGGAGDDRAEELGAGRVGERHDAAGERVGETPARGVEGLVARGLGAEGVVGEFDEQWIGRGTDVGDVGAH